MGALKRSYEFVAEVLGKAGEDQVPLVAAGLGFYALISLAPLLVVVIAIASFIFGEQAAHGQVVAEIRGLIGDEGADAISGMIRRASQPSSSLTAAGIGLAVLLFGASRVFLALQGAMNTVWNVQPPPVRGGIPVALIKYRAISFLMVLGTGFLLLVSLLASAALSALTNYFSGVVPGADWLWRAANFVFQLVVSAVIFALIFKVVPDVRIRWRTAATGGLVTALMFSLLRFVLGALLGHGTFTSVYGAAGSLVIVLFWAWWSAQILCLGAEFTQVYARRRGEPVPPVPGARKINACPPAPATQNLLKSESQAKGSSTMASGTIYDTLKKDHRAVSELLEKLLNTGDNEVGRRKELFNEIFQELKGHSEAEAEVMYSRLEDHKESRMKTLEGEEEHHLVEMTLAELAEEDKGNDRWLAKVQVLKELVEHHVEEEESELFEKAQKVFSKEEAEDLAQRFQDAKSKHITQMQGGNFPG